MCFLIPRVRTNCLLALGFLLLLPIATRAQNEAGRIDGVVTDVTGARVARAKIIITTRATSVDLQTDEMGEFHAVVPFGMSRITVESPGFKVAKLNRVRVAPGSSRSLKIVLTVRPVKYGKCPKGKICLWL